MRFPCPCAVGLSLALLLGVGCADARQRLGGDEAASTALTGTILNQAEALGLPGAVAATDGHVVVVDYARDPSLHVLDSREGTLILSLGRAGEGPGEFRSAREVQIHTHDPLQFWVFDIGLKRLTRIDLERARADPLRPADRYVSFRDSELPLAPVWAAERIFSPGIFDGGRLAVFRPDGTLEGTFGELPAAPEGTPASVVQHAFTGPIAAHPGGQLLAVATRHADRLDIYAVDGGHVTTVRGSSGFDPQYQTRFVGGAPTMASGDDLRFGYIDLSATADHVYALFSGRQRREFPGRASYGQTVHVFDWEGSRVATYELDAETLGLAVDPSGTRLYTLRQEPAPAVLVYDLPAIPPAH